MEPPIHVLVVDDDVAIRRLMVLLFEREGWRVQTAGDGETGLEVLRTRCPDVLVLDLMLPGRSGFDVLDWISSTNPALLGQVIVVTAVSAKILGALRHGAAVWRVVRKPFDIAQLVEDVRACAAAHRSAAADMPRVDEIATARLFE